MQRKPVQYKEISFVEEIRVKLLYKAVVLQRKSSKSNVCATFLQQLLGLAEAHVFAQGKQSSKLHFATEKAFQDFG